jgi:hypothetical protein
MLHDSHGLAVDFVKLMKLQNLIQVTALVGSDFQDIGKGQLNLLVNRLGENL